MSKFNRPAVTDQDYYDASMVYAKNPNYTGVRMLKQCEKRFHFNTNPAEICPKNSYLNYGCLDNLGKDLVCNEYLVPPMPVTQEQHAIRQSISNRWKQVSLEGCTVKRVMDWSPSSSIDRNTPVSTVPMNTSAVAEMGLPDDMKM